jgi:hypothetical protein
MKCYFFGTNLHEQKLIRKQGLISFAIPDYGVLFRAQYIGNRYECEYAAGIALIRFLQLNMSHFDGKPVTLMTDSPIVVYQVNNKLAALNSLQKFRDLFLFYKRKLKFELQWVPTKMNRAEMGLEGLAVNKNSPKFNFDIFEESTRRKQRPHRNPDEGVQIS